jgi:MFS family permease
MAADLGTVIGPVAIGALAQHVSYGVAFSVTGGLLAVAAVVWTVVPEPLRPRAPATDVERGMDHVSGVCDDAQYRLAHRAAEGCAENSPDCRSDATPEDPRRRRVQSC